MRCRYPLVEKKWVEMNIDAKQAAAVLLLGIAIGCAVSHFYFAGFLDDRATDGLPVAMNGKMYEVREVNQTERINTIIPFCSMRACKHKSPFLCFPRQPLTRPPHPAQR